MVKWLNGILVLVAVILFTACANKGQKSEEASNGGGEQLEEVKTSKEDLAAIRAKLLGSWQWEKTICCSRTPQTQSAEELNKNVTMKFTAEDQVEQYSNEKLVKTVDYKLGMMEGDRPTIQYSDVTYPAMLTFKGDTLIVDYGYMDLQVEYYIRK